MPLMFDVLYGLAMIPAVPVVALKGWRTGKHRTGWAGRFGFGGEVFPEREPGQKVLLLHCVSVGELLSVQTLIARLLEADANLLIVVSTTTDTGTARAESLYPSTHPRVRAVRFALDFSFAVESLFDRVRPDAVALVELETWPNFLSIASSRRVPVGLVNGRLSERSFPRYRLIRPVMKGMLDRLGFIGVQTEAIGERFAALGAAAEKIEVIPTLKYDNAVLGSTVPGQDALAAAMGLSSEHQLFVGGSTGPGEESPLLDAYLHQRTKFPALRLAIAPRKPESMPALLAAAEARGLEPILRTQRPDGLASTSLRTSEVFVLNTLGELKKLYALAFGVFVGRSLVKLGGSDMIEVAALGKPCCFGPSTSNFAEVVELLLGEKAAVEVKDGPALTATLGEWLQKPEAAVAMGVEAQKLIELQRGSTEHYVRKLLALLATKTPKISGAAIQSPRPRG